MLVAALAACLAFHVGPPEVLGPHLAQEVAIVQKAVTARVAKLPGHCKARDARRWVSLVEERRTQSAGPVCAAPPRMVDLLELRGGVRLISPLLDGGSLSFGAGDLRFEVPLAFGASRRWPAEIARAKGFHGGAIGGGRGLRMVGSPMGVFVDLFRGWKSYDEPMDLEAVSAALAICHEGGPRDPHQAIDYTVVVVLGPRGEVTRAEHRAEDHRPTGGEKATCILERIRGLRFPPGAQRAVVLVSDRAPEPIPFMKPLLNFRVDSQVGLISAGPFYDEPRFHRCVLPLGETPFTLKLDESGRVLEAQVPGLEGEVRTCAEDALRHVGFPCPEGGPATVEGRMVVR